MLYDSETFVVMALQADAISATEVSVELDSQDSSSQSAAKKVQPKLERYGFEIVDKRVGK